jgi:1-acyl-sn-glycerol-3-phosphate acyltransferase
MLTLLARWFLALWRWKVVPGPEPVPERCVMIAAPHTSNWDFLITLAMARVVGVKINWLGKREMFAGPAAPIMRRLGGVPVDRSAPGGLVESLAKTLTDSDRMVLVVPAEGTRSKTEYWKSGFYRIAEMANVPIVCAYVDMASRSGGFGPVITPTGDLVADMDVMREFYADKTGIKPNRFGPVRLREEDASTD